MGIIDTVYPDGVAVQKSNVRADDKTGHRRNMASVDDVRNADLSGQTAGIYVRQLQQFYDLDTGDTTSPDDGDDCIIDYAGNRFKKLNLGSGGGASAADYATKSDVESATIPGALDFLRIAGYAAAGDGGGALYKRVVSEPAHAGKIQSDDGAWWEIAEKAISVKMLGAVGDGIVDDSSSIQNSIDCLPASGGTVLFPGGSYLISTTIQIGDGALNTWSTKNGIRLIGAGLPGYNDGSINGTTQLVWGGASGGTLISVNGPMRGWEISNLSLQGQALANYGILCQSAANFRSTFLTFTNFRINAAGFFCRSGSPTSNSMMGMVDNWVIHQSAVTNNYGIILDGDPTVPASSYLIHFTNVQIFPRGGSVDSTAVYLRVADTCRFTNLLVFAAAPGLHARAVVFDYTSGNTLFPASNVFDTPDVGYNIDSTLQWVHNGGSGTGTPNKIISLTQLNGGVFPAQHPNLVVTDGRVEYAAAGSVPYYSAAGYSVSAASGFSIGSSTLTLPKLIGSDATDSSSSTTGAFKTAGGLGVAKTMRAGTAIISEGYIVTTTGYFIGANIFASVGGNYTAISSSPAAGGTSFQFGNSNDPTVYLNADSGYKYRNGSGVTLYGQLDANGFLSAGYILSSSPTKGVGYTTGAGGTVTQATSKSTGVTLSKVSGAITMNNAALGAATIVSFVLTNTAISATDVLVLNHISGGTVGSYTLNAQCAAGSATINVRNNTAGSLSEAIVIQFALMKGVNA